jgi:hypothetical protein
VTPPGNVNLLIGVARIANQEFGVPGFPPIRFAKGR